MLVRFFKAAVKDRPPDSVPLSHRNVSNGTAIPFPWILRAVEANLLPELFPRNRMHATWDGSFKVFRVPSTFGMNWIDSIA
jgi:hypothetical protein